MSNGYNMGAYCKKIEKNTLILKARIKGGKFRTRTLKDLTETEMDEIIEEYKLITDTTYISEKTNINIERKAFFEELFNKKLYTEKEHPRNQNDNLSNFLKLNREIVGIAVFKDIKLLALKGLSAEEIKKKIVNKWKRRNFSFDKTYLDAVIQTEVECA